MTPADPQRERPTATRSRTQEPSEERRTELPQDPSPVTVTLGSPLAASSRFKLVCEYEPRGDQPKAIAELVAGLDARRAAPGPPGRHGLRQDLHHGQRDRGRGAPHPDHRPQQDAGGAALQRVQAVLPRERRRVLRLLLRLLPARGLHPADGHLHREGLRHQRQHRQAAPLRHAKPPGAAGRRHRGLRLLHLRPGLARGVLRHGAPPGGGEREPPRRHAPEAGRDPVPAERPGPPPGDLPSAGRRGGDLPRLRRLRHPGGAVRGPGGVDRPVRSADRRKAGAPAPGPHLPRQPLRHAPGSAGARLRRHRGRA